MATYCIVKASFKGEHRRFRHAVNFSGIGGCPNTSSITALKAQISDKFALDGTFILKYLDQDGDLITVTSDEELGEAFYMASLMEHQVLRMQVVPATSSSRPVLSASSSADNSNNVLDSESAKPVHFNVSCDVCKCYPIVGVRFKCAVRQNYDICEECEKKDASTYPYIRIDKPQTYPRWCSMAHPTQASAAYVNRTAAAACATPKATHPGVQCDMCDAFPIVGPRFKCTVRQNYDICEECEKKDTSKYPYIKINEPSQVPLGIVTMLPDSVEEGTDGRAGCRSSSRQSFAVEVPVPPSCPESMDNSPSYKNQEAESKVPASADQEVESLAGKTVELVSVSEGATYGPYLIQPSAGGHESSYTFRCVERDSGKVNNRRRGGKFLRTMRDGTVDHNGCARGSKVPMRVQFLNKETRRIRLISVQYGHMLASHERKLFGTRFPMPATEFVLLDVPSTVSSTSHQAPTLPITQKPQTKAVETGSSQNLMFTTASTSSSAAAFTVTGPKLMASFVNDITIPDGSVVKPGETFIKRWLIRNDSDQAFPQGCQLKFIRGSKIGAEALVIPVDGVLPLEERELAVVFTAPSKAGRYVSFWRFFSPSGQVFGCQLWCDISVAAPCTEPVQSEFLEDAKTDEKPQALKRSPSVNMEFPESMYDSMSEVALSLIETTDEQDDDKEKQAQEDESGGSTPQSPKQDASKLPLEWEMVGIPVKSTESRQESTANFSNDLLTPPPLHFPRNEARGTFPVDVPASLPQFHSTETMQQLSAPPTLSSPSNPFANEPPSMGNANSPSLDEPLVKWKEAIDLYLSMGFSDVPGLIQFLDGAATPDSWHQTLQNFINSNMDRRN